MKNIILLILLLLPAASFAEETTDDGAQNGAAFLNGEHKAYLAIPTTDINGSAAKSGYVFTEEGATAINKVSNNGSKPAYYTLDGKRCQQGYKGIMISNGRKTIKR